MLCDSLDGRGVWGIVDIWICTTESLSCPPEIATTLLISYMLIQNKKFKKINKIEKKKTFKLLSVPTRRLPVLLISSMLYSPPLYLSPYLIYLLGLLPDSPHRICALWEQGFMYVAHYSP